MAYFDIEVIEPNELLQEVRSLRDAVVSEGQAQYSEWEPLLEREEFRFSALNLARYLSLRSRDLRRVQSSMPYWGLSSLGRAEARVLSNLNAVIATLADIAQVPSSERPTREEFVRGPQQLAANCDVILGPKPKGRRVRILVTMPRHAANDYDFIKDLMHRGMNMARINCAHDDPDIWLAMITNIRRAEEELDRTCNVLMDLGGPKVRTGEVKAYGEKRTYKGDRILLVRDMLDKKQAREMKLNFQIGCTEPAIIEQVPQGAEIWIDDGSVGTVVEEKSDDWLLLRVEHVDPKGKRLREEKGLNFPDTVLHLPPLTEKDLEDLDFVVKHANAIGYSFVQEPADIDWLQEEIKKRIEDPARFYELAVIAKIETQAAVANLPSLIVHAAGRQPFGVMIARGDLAVEIGYRRLAEIQEEILWICEAAHVPVIWATQVFENFAKTGIPSRAEVTDAAMSERAECVMLNKGPFIHEVVSALDNVLHRMQAHQTKKVAQLRELHSWQ